MLNPGNAIKATIIGRVLCQLRKRITVTIDKPA